MNGGPARRRLVGILVAALLVATGLAGCGEQGPPASSAPRSVTLVLDYVAGPPHIGIYLALARDYYERAGIELEVVEPTSTADTLRLIEAGRADFGIADGIDVAGQIAAGRNARAVLALAQRPLGGLITLGESGFDSPAALEGTTVGVTGVPSDAAVVETSVASAGGDPSAVRQVTIGFAGVRALQNRRIAAFTGFIPADGVQVESGGFPVRAFPFDRWGGPQYPGLVLFTTESRIAEDQGLVRDFAAVTVRGYEDALADPDAGIEALLAENPEIDRRFARDSVAAMLPYFTVPGVPFGSLRSGRIRQLSDFLVDWELIDEPIDPRRYGTTEFLP